MSEHSSNIETTIIPPEIPPAVFTGELAAEALPRPRSVRESIRNWREGRKPQLASAEDLRIVVSPAFHTRAVNSDNHLDAVRLVKLFESHYGVNFPFKRVYETDFWSHRLHNRPSVENLTSIVAVQEEKFIAHLAYDCNQCLGTATNTPPRCSSGIPVEAVCADSFILAAHRTNSCPAKLETGLYL